MAIESSEIKYRLSGGAANSNAAASLGGVASSVDVPNPHLPNVTSAQAAAGRVRYRCFYVKNIDPLLTLTGAKLWIQANTPGAQTTIDVGLGTSAIDGEEQTVADEVTAPSGVSFSAAANEAAALSIGDLGPGAHKAFWLRDTVTAGATAVNETYTIRVKGDTLP